MAALWEKLLGYGTRNLDLLLFDGMQGGKTGVEMKACKAGVLLGAS